MNTRSFYSLTFKSGPYCQTPIILAIRTLLRGEVFGAYLALGFPDQQIPEESLVAKEALEVELFRLGCIETPDDLPAGIYTRVAEEILRLSGFLENSTEQAKILSDAARYSQGAEGRGDALIMATFSQYTLEDLQALGLPEWSRILMLAMVYCNECSQVDPQAFIAGQSQQVEDSPPELEGPSAEFAQSVFGFSSRRQGGGVVTPIVAGGGTITAAGHKSWGVGKNLESGKAL